MKSETLRRLFVLIMAIGALTFSATVRHAHAQAYPSPQEILACETQYGDFLNKLAAAGRTTIGIKQPDGTMLIVDQNSVMKQCQTGTLVKIPDPAGMWWQKAEETPASPLTLPQSSK